MAFQLDNIQQAQKAPEQKNSISEVLQKEITLFGKSLSNKKKEALYTELSVLLKAGVHLKEALTLRCENEKKKTVKAFLSTLIHEIMSGKTFSEAVKTNKEITTYEYYSLQIGEETGTLDKVTALLGDFFAGKNEQRRHLISALTYPVIIFSTAVLVVVFMLRFIVPMFQDIFKQHQVALPAVTKFIIALSEFLKEYGFLFIIVIVLFFVFKRVVSKKKRVAMYSDRFILKLPFIGNFIKMVYLIQVIQAMVLLASARVPIVNSIALVRKMVAFYPLHDALQQVEKNMLKGHSLSESLKQNKIFDVRMVAMIKVAEETNTTEFIFEKLYEHYAVEVRQRSKVLTTLMEPLIIVFIGILVGVILIAMYLPMFKLSSVLG